jgi:hypothetical protein
MKRGSSFYKILLSRFSHFNIVDTITILTLERITHIAFLYCTNICIVEIKTMKEWIYIKSRTKGISTECNEALRFI